MVRGLVYCAVISACHNVYALDRAREWTAVLSAWCESQPQLAAFNGKCRVPRSELHQLQGDWEEAITEAHHAVAPQAPSDVVAAAQYQEAEIRRLRGEFAEAEAAYHQASRHGRDPQPGLALLRLAQGNHAAAAAQIRAALDAARDPLVRTRYLPAAVEIQLATGDRAAATDAARALAQIAENTDHENREAL